MVLRSSASVCPVASVPFSFCQKLEVAVPTLRRIGFGGIELLLRSADDIELLELERLMSKYELKVSAVGTGLATLDGLYLGSQDESMRLMAVERVKGFCKLAERLDCGVVIGSIKGGVSPRPSLSSFARSMKELGEARLIIEPLNRYESAILNTAYQTLEFAHDNDLQGLGILLDTFHMNIEERSMEEAARNVGNRLAHVHVADSNRMAPGYGHIDFRGFFQALRDIEYDGYVSAEILQEPTPEVALRKSMDFLKTI